MAYDEHATKEFPSGFYAKSPHPNAPDFVKARISIKIADFQVFLSTKTSEWIHLDVKESRKIGDDGLKKWYAEVDTWQPKSSVARTEPDDDAF